MTDPIPDPKVVVNQPPTAPIDWTKIFAFIVTAIAALLAGPHVVPPVNPPAPVVVTPPVTPPVVTPPIVNPPIVTPPVVVTPVVTPPQPVSNLITVTDSSGAVINGGVNPNQNFIVSVTEPTAIFGTVLPDKTYGEIIVISEQKIVCKLSAGGSVQLIAYSAGTKPVPLTVMCLAPQPPPVIPPVVNPPVVVTPPTPAGSKRFTVTVVEDSKSVRTVTTASILNNLSIRKTLTDKGHAFSATTNATSDAAAVYVRNNPTTLPALVIFDNSTQTFIKAIPLPTDLGMSTLASLGG